MPPQASGGHSHGRLQLLGPDGTVLDACTVSAGPAGTALRLARTLAVSSASLLARGIPALRAHELPVVSVTLRLPVDDAEQAVLGQHGLHLASHEGEYARTLSVPLGPNGATRVPGLRRHNWFNLPRTLAGPALRLLEAAAAHRPEYQALPGAIILERLMAQADENPATSLWSLYCRRASPVAVALPSCGAFGTLMAFGVAPSAQGQGWGRRIHAATLARLQRAGAYVYLDHVGRTNRPMRRIMAANGCCKVAAYATFQDGTAPAGLLRL